MYVEVILGKGVGKGASKLTYFSSLNVEPGMIVEVPLMRGKAPAVVFKKVAQPNFKCKEIVRILYSKPLPWHLVKVAEWMAEYYLAPLSGVMGMILPTGVLKKRRSSGAGAKTEQTEHFSTKTEQVARNSVPSTRSRRPVVTGGASLSLLPLSQDGLGSTILKLATYLSDQGVELEFL